MLNPDRAARVGIPDAEIARLTAERDRLLAGGDMPDVGADCQGFAELTELVAGLPPDFARVSESFPVSPKLRRSPLRPRWTTVR